MTPAPDPLDMAGVVERRLDEIAALAKAATPGVWFYADNAPRSYGSAWVDTPDVRRLAVCDGTRRSDTHGFCLRMAEEENERNAAYIAAANPAFVLELIEAHRALLSAFKARGEALERLASSAEDVRQMLDRDITRQGPEFRALGIPFVAAIARARALSPTVKG